MTENKKGSMANVTDNSECRLTRNILMSSTDGCTGGWVVCTSSTGDMILAKRIIFCMLRRPPLTVSGRTVCKEIRSFS